MPNTKTPRKPGKWTVSHSVMFPGGHNQDSKANQRARVAIGDKGVNRVVANSVNADRAIYGKASYYKGTKASVTSDTQGRSQVRLTKVQAPGGYRKSSKKKKR